MWWFVFLSSHLHPNPQKIPRHLELMIPAILCETSTSNKNIFCILGRRKTPFSTMYVTIYLLVKPAGMVPCRKACIPTASCGCPWGLLPSTVCRATTGNLWEVNTHGFFTLSCERYHMVGRCTVYYPRQRDIPIDYLSFCLQFACVYVNSIRRNPF